MGIKKSSWEFTLALSTGSGSALASLEIPAFEYIPKLRRDLD